MAKGIPCKICGELIPLKKKFGKQRTRHDSCWRKQYWSTVKGAIMKRVGYETRLAKARAIRAFKNLKPQQRVADENFVLHRRKKHHRPGRWIKCRECATCGESFFGGNAAKRCWGCEILYRRAIKKFYWLRSKRKETE